MRSFSYLPFLAFVAYSPLSAIASPVGIPPHARKCSDCHPSSVVGLTSDTNVKAAVDGVVGSTGGITSTTNLDATLDKLNVDARLCLVIGGTGCGHEHHTSPSPTTSSHTSTSTSTPTPTHSSCNSAGCNEIDIWVWLNDLYAKVIVYIDLLDGKNDPHEPCLKIISEIDSAIALLADIKIDLTHDHGNKCNDIIGLLIDLVVKLVVGLSKYSLTVSIGILTKLDICLSKLFGNSLTDLSIFIKLASLDPQDLRATMSSFSNTFIT
ncbi:uncharacterized protein EI90DRAFT_3026148 [Cantharellus anzutake]|uniref:uncharacterized protein n=1 Tax=Cantharellus anzutake TaxID=1750568 RepID=UPI0019068E0E|nr:uncharacterized protein EI90DRAFT_3026148 [Cantharellus anzutake]KAF8308293.1 hypothetical protein EI90DRAFT_3026148 [Cantharellus anzutake]